MNRKDLLRPARSVLHVFRRVVQRLLGLNGIVQAHHSSVRQVGPLRTNEIYQRILDRVCLLESHVNWRLLGLPNQIGNVRLEQAAALSSHQDLLGLIQMLVEKRFDEREGQKVQENLRNANRALIVGSYNLFGGRVDWGDMLQRCTILQDPDDVTSVAWQVNQVSGGVVAGLLPYLLSLDDDCLDFVWLGNSLQRSAPLHRLLILRNALRVLKKNGCLLGVQEARNDIQFQTEMDWGVTEVIGLPGRTVELRDGFYRITKPD